MKGCAAAGLRLDPHTSAIIFHDLLTNRQSYPRAGIFFRRVMKALENSKHPQVIFGSNTDAIVSYNEVPLAFLP